MDASKKTGLRHPEVMKLIDLKKAIPNPVYQRLYQFVEKPVEKILGLDSFNDVYRMTSQNGKSENYLQHCLNILGIGVNLQGMPQQNIPEAGGMIVVANHPFGGIEGIVLAEMIRQVRSDVKIMGNYLLEMIPEMRPWILPVNPFETAKESRSSLKGLRDAIRWVKDGGVLIVFPAGEVSHIDLQQGEVTDRPWSRHIGRLIQMTKSTVLPVYIPGQNSPLFQLFGLLHPRLRTALLPVELLKKSNHAIDVVVGKPVGWNKLATRESDEELIRYLRQKTYLLSHIDVKDTPMTTEVQREDEKIIDPVDVELLDYDIESLPEHNKLVSVGGLSVYFAAAQQIPNVLTEIGRLREETFRKVGEGTGKMIDLDSFDQYYYHLFMWDEKNHCIAGGYRLGFADEIIREKGLKGLYTYKLFHYKQELTATLQDAIEVGRSFVTEEYQKKPTSLALLWRGIGEVIVRNEQYNKLFGPVSISQDYQLVSRNLMIQFLKKDRLDKKLSRLVKARTPFRTPFALSRSLPRIGGFLRSIEDVSMLVSELETDGKGIPVLLRHYYKLNARMLNFNVDPEFGNALDCLILVDLRETEERILGRYMGAEGLSNFKNRQPHQSIPEMVAESLLIQ